MNLKKKKNKKQKTNNLHHFLPLPELWLSDVRTQALWLFLEGLYSLKVCIPGELWCKEGWEERYLQAHHS